MVSPDSCFQSRSFRRMRRARSRGGWVRRVRPCAVRPPSGWRCRHGLRVAKACRTTSGASGQNVLQGIVQRVTDMQAAGDVRQRDHHSKGLVVRFGIRDVNAGLEGPALFPLRADAAFRRPARRNSLSMLISTIPLLEHGLTGKPGKGGGNAAGEKPLKFAGRDMGRPPAWAARLGLRSHAGVKPPANAPCDRPMPAERRGAPSPAPHRPSRRMTGSASIAAGTRSIDQGISAGARSPAISQRPCMTRSSASSRADHPLAGMFHHLGG